MRRHVIIIGDMECEPCKQAEVIIRRYGVVPEIIDITKKQPMPMKYLFVVRKCNRVPLIIFIRGRIERYLCGLDIEKLAELLEWCFG